MGQPPIRLDEGDLHSGRLVVVPRGVGVELSVGREGITDAAVVCHLQVGSRPGATEGEPRPPVTC